MSALIFAMLTGFSCVAIGADFTHENTPQNLKAFFERIHHTLYVQQDSKQAAALFDSLIPDEARIRKALREDVAADAVQQILELQKSFGRVTEREVGKVVVGPTHKVAWVYGATTEEIARYTEGSLAYKAFAGGARRIAKNVLRPGMTYYQVEYQGRGQKVAMKYNLLYWDGKQWTMLGPAWQAFKR